jgi:hypothetical protein
MRGFLDFVLHTSLGMTHLRQTLHLAHNDTSEENDTSNKWNQIQRACFLLVLRRRRL